MKNRTDKQDPSSDENRQIPYAAVPVFLAAAAATVTYKCQTFTLLHQEGRGLFLNTPDFYGELFREPLPISHLIGSFLVQFYSRYAVGVAVITAMVLGVYFIYRALFRRLGLEVVMMPTACACLAWWFIARSSDPSTGVAILLFSSLAALLTAFTGVRGKREAGRCNPSLATLVVIGTACAVVLSPKVKEAEKWSRIEFAGVQGSWDYLLRYATPEEAKKDMEVVPWALLALNVQGRLDDSLAAYPVAREFGLDYGDRQSCRASLFYALLYSRLGVYNESVHKVHQCGDYLPHGTSFRTLRMLVQENYKLKDSLMVVKYCDILDRSTLHHEFTSWFREHPCPQRAPSSYGQQGADPIIVLTKNQMETMLNIGRAGLDSRMAMERYHAYYRILHAE